MSFTGTTQAEEPLLNGLFVDHAVLQRDRPLHIYGQAKAGEEVSVSIAGASAGAKADAKGAWQLTLPAMAAGGPHTLVARAGAKTQTVSDILLGDVWLCSGQSNMEWPVRNTLDAGSEVALSANDRIRQVTIARATAPRRARISMRRSCGKPQGPPPPNTSPPRVTTSRGNCRRP